MLNITGSESKKHARYLVGRVMLSLGTLMFGSFFTMAMTLRPEQDGLRSHLFFHTGIGIVMAFFGVVLVLMFAPDFGISFARKTLREEDKSLYRRASIAMGILSLFSLTAAAFVFFFGHRIVTTIFMVAYGIYLGLVSLNFGKGRKRTWSSSVTRS